jgi:GT2 family glycosyltransferase
MRGNIDTPSEGENISGNLTIRGWSFHPVNEISTVEVFLDGMFLGSLEYGIERTDVSELFQLEKFKNCGFFGTIHPRGFAEGKHHLVVRVTDALYNVDEYCTTINIISNPIKANFDDPAEDSLIKNILEVRGWAFSEVAPIEKVELFLGDEFLGKINYGLERQDVKDAFPDSAPLATGFKERFNCDHSWSGEQLLRLVVTDKHKNKLEAVKKVFIKKPSIVIYIDKPQKDTIVNGIIPLRGWAFSFNAPIKRITGWLGDHLLGQLASGTTRNDVYAVYQNQSALTSGFEGVLYHENFSAGLTKLRLLVEDALGDTAEHFFEVEFANPSPGMAEIEKAVWQGNHLEVSGWALWEKSDHPRTARVFLNQNFVAQVSLNLSRPDIAKRFPYNPLAYRCGFWLQEIVLPSETEFEKLNELTVEFVDGDGTYLKRSLHVAHKLNTNLEVNPLTLNIFQAFLEDYELRYKSKPAVLDWHTDLNLIKAFPEYAIFSPKFDEANEKLPYIDQSVEVVLLDTNELTSVAEAQRVAEKAVVKVKRISPELVQFEVDWLLDAKPAIFTTSIVIPVYNKVNYTKACLARLFETLPTYFEGEVIVIDDASTDETAEFLTEMAKEVPYLKIIHNTTNKGFIYNCNKGVELATGEIIVFLNNDTLPQAGWLQPLWRVLKDKPKVGAVGAKLIYPDGSLQEAGGVIFNDASGHNYGKSDFAANSPAYQFVREVDYCSGALLATYRKLFLELAGFDELYSPAYYEDADFCFKLRKAGYKVYYQPDSVIVHFEGVSSGRSLKSGVKKYQVDNRLKFKEKWATELKDQPKPLKNFELAELRRVLIRNGRRNQKDSKNDN